MKKTFFFAAVILCMTTTFYAQTSDLAKIETVINDLYFEGWMTGDTTKLGQAMHATCHLKYYRDNQFGDMSRSEYLNRFKPKTKEAGTSGRIVSLDVKGNIASAKCEIETAKSIFTDYFNLIRVEERWFIVDKVSTRVDKEIKN